MGMIALIRTIRHRDEARPTIMEVILAYPGFHIMSLFYPAGRFLWRLRLRALARLWMYIGRFFTGIEIHPAAQIGKNFFIDHGTGVVIGETAIIGDECRIYHGVTLGGRGDITEGRRHPQLGDHVIVGAGALVLGPLHIGDAAQIGAGAVVTSDIPAKVTAVGNPARLLGRFKSEDCAYGLPEGAIPDPLEARICALESKLAAQEKKRV